MRNKLLIFFYLVFFNTEVLAENININAKKISFDKNKKLQFLKMKFFLKLIQMTKLKLTMLSIKK